MSEERRAKRDRELQRALAMSDQVAAAWRISEITGLDLEESAIMWSNENGRGGDVLGGPDGDHERRRGE